VWVLIALAEEPGHLYGLRGRVYGGSMAYAELSREAIRSSMRVLLREGLVEEVGAEAGKASQFDRKLYVISRKGLKVLVSERTGLTVAVQAIDRAFARRAIADGDLPLARRA
jgi:DNA-binding PadR family transcriptional regulator